MSLLRTYILLLTFSPFVPFSIMPLTIVPENEFPILENLISIRHHLSALKKDRKSYIKSSDVLSLYDRTIEQVKSLCDIRKDPSEWDQERRNRLDDVLDDVFQLLSLFFMTIGKNQSSMAVYVQLVTMQQLLHQIDEGDVYSMDVLAPYDQRLNEIAEIIHNDAEKDTVPYCQVTLVNIKLEQCNQLLQSLYAALKTISPELQPIQSRLVHIRRELASLFNKNHIHSADVKNIQDELRSIDDQRVDGKFLFNGSIPAGQAIIISLLEQCFEDVHDLIANKDDINEALRPIYDRLVDIKGQLEKLSLTHRWTLRETDLWAYQMQLQEIDSMRKRGSGKFLDEDGNAPEGQAALNFMLHKCRRLVWKMLSESEPVAEALMPIHNQLSTVSRCLQELKKYGGPLSIRELYPYQMKLNSIDNLRQDGIFYDDDHNIPEGQAACTALLNECYDLLYDLKAESGEE